MLQGRDIKHPPVNGPDSVVPDLDLLNNIPNKGLLARFSLSNSFQSSFCILSIANEPGSLNNFCENPLSVYKLYSPKG